MQECLTVNRASRDGRTHEGVIAVLGQQIRVNIRWATGVPLVLCNGIGASLEVLDPFVEQLDADTTVVRLDVPGTGGSPDSPVPYRFPYLAAVLASLLKKVGVLGGASGSPQVDILGLSWGGALAPQFAFQNPRRCRRLILVSTATGSIMVPAHPAVLGKMLTRGAFWTTGMPRWSQPNSTVGRLAVIRT
jgi:pimeloyl-ACP methyl ester carboxylesterase